MYWYINQTNSGINQQTNNDTHQSKDAPEKTRNETLSCVAAMPLNQRIGQKIMAAGYSSQIEATTPSFATSYIGGVIIMDDTSAGQIAAFRDAMPIPPLVATDQEGGPVQRYKSEGDLPSAEQIAKDTSLNDAYQIYLTDNQYLKQQGITTNFAPVVDVISRSPNPLPGRIYSSDPEIVSKYAAANIKAANDAGITPVIKHFPGIGSATGNTDYTSAVTDPFSALETRDLAPYKTLAALHPDIMVGNMIVPGLTDEQPAIWSRSAVDLLRSLGYENAVIYSDSLTAAAIPGTIADATVKTWQAGVDIAVIVQTDTDTKHLDSFFKTIIQRAAEAVQSGELSEDTLNQSVLRILSRKQVDPCEITISKNTPHSGGRDEEYQH